MSIVAGDLICYDSAATPTDDTSTSGGAIDTASRPALTQFSGNAVAAVISDGADTRTVTVTGRLTTGAVDTEVLTLNGAVEVVGAKTWERVLSYVLSASSASRTVLVKQGSGGSTSATLSVNETKRHISFQNSASAGTSKLRYEKQFWKNTHATLTLNSAAVMLTADPASKITIGLDTAINATVSVANRLTAPSSVSFVDDNVSQSVPGGVLAAADRIGVWILQTLGINDAAQKSTYTTQLSGTTT